MRKTIDRFKNEFFFLSNFYPVRIETGGLVFQSVECAYQASKCDKLKDRQMFTSISPANAKLLARQLRMRRDWSEATKLLVMHDLLALKFCLSPQVNSLAQRLVDTEDARLIEGNSWGDRFWGVYRKQGENHMGRLLMQRRDWLMAQGMRPRVAATV